MKLLKNKIFFGFIFSLIVSILGYVLRHSYDFGVCYSNIETRVFDASCHYEALLWGNKLFFFSFALALIFLIILFVPRAVSAWKKFAVWYVPIVAIIIVGSSPSTSTLTIGPSYVQIIQFFAIAYAAISLIIILKVTFLKKKDSGT